MVIVNINFFIGPPDIIDSEAIYHNFQFQSKKYLTISGPNFCQKASSKITNANLSVTFHHKKF